MSNDSLKHIVIVGGGTAGWMTAAALAKVIGTKHCAVTLVEADSIAPVGVGEATIPPIATFNSILGINPLDMLRETQGTFKLGIEFSNWGAIGERYMHPFGSIGKSINNVAFHHYWQKAHSLGLAPPLEAFSLNALAAQAGKFAPAVVAQGQRPTPIVHAYHFDAALYAQFLARFSTQLGVTRVQGQVRHVEQNPDSGYIEKLHLDCGRTLTGDFFIDCTGFRGLLIEQTLHAGYEEWSHYLPCDRAVALPTTAVEPPPPFTQAIARGCGWQWRIPLQHRTGNGLVYSSQFLSDADAAEQLLSHVEGQALGAPRQLQFTTGRRKRVWYKNCLAIGLASGFLEPLESTSIHLIQSAISRFLGLFPRRDGYEAEMRRYNTLAEQEVLSIRDFLILHYSATRRTDTPFWDYCRTMPVPDSLHHKLALYNSSGGIYRDNNELFSEASWLAVLNGQGVGTGRYHPLVDVLPEATLKQRVASIGSALHPVLSALPEHADYITQFCKSPPASLAAPSPVTP